jgi:diguanylate cyclase (GGDEF)-like protein
LDFVTPEQAALYRANDLQVLETGQPNESEEPFRDGSGQTRTIITRKNLLILPDGSKYLVGSITDITEFRRIEEMIRHQATHDALTGLANRQVLTAEIAGALAEGGLFAVHCIDLDFFKAVNDTLGHGAGDQVLKTAGNRLKECCDETDVVARVGGDEFALLQRKVDRFSEAQERAANIVSKIGMPIHVETHQVQIGASIGVSVGPSDGTDPESLTRKADVALYQAKASGRATYSFYHSSMDDALHSKTILRSTIRQALYRCEFFLEYQPFVRLSDAKICGVEALLRWRHPTLSILSPDRFLSLAEETREIIPIGAWVLREACQQATHWPSHIRIAVNLSPLQFESGRLIEHVMSALTLASLQNERLELEVTEMTLLKDNASTTRQLNELKALGIKVAMDDFGTGFSSLSYLQTFSFDTIKIDKAFVQAVETSKESRAIVAAVAELGQSLGIRTIAEGVETNGQLDFVRDKSCVECQGYLFSPPVPGQIIDDLIGLMQPNLRKRRSAKVRRARRGIA